LRRAQLSPRKDANGNRISDARRLACSSDFGDPNRSSDPSIGLGVNLTAFPVAAGTLPQSITLANPVALYLDRIAPGVITDENENPLSGWFKIVRGTGGRGLMAVLQPPPGAAFGLDKIQVLGRKLSHGGQVAEHIQMVLYAKTANLGHPSPPIEQCIGHCCRPDNAVPTEQNNLRHAGQQTSCAGANPRDAFPELVSGVAGPTGGLGPAPVTSEKPLRKLTRLSEPVDG